MSISHNWRSSIWSIHPRIWRKSASGSGDAAGIVGMAAMLGAAWDAAGIAGVAAMLGAAWDAAGIAGVAAALGAAWDIETGAG